MKPLSLIQKDFYANKLNQKAYDFNEEISFKYFFYRLKKTASMIAFTGAPWWLPGGSCTFLCNGTGYRAFQTYALSENQ